MNKRNQIGAVNGVAVSLVLCIILLIAAIGVALWAIAGRSDYKDNSDKKVAAAVSVAKQQQTTIDNKRFAEEAKNPLKTYQGPEADGSLNIAYPKTWSGYVVSGTSSSTPLDGYFAPGVVPSTQDQNSVFALRVQVIGTQYDDAIKNFQGQVQSGKLKSSVYALPKLPKVVGIKVEGQIDNQTQVTMIVLPLRSQTLKIWTEGTQYLDDFNNNIIPNFTFSP